MPNRLDSSISIDPEKQSGGPADWLKVAAVAAGSVLAGGMLAVWWYRKTLAKLREAEENGQNPHFGIPADQPEDEA